jgi:hypothetical protein
MADPYKESEDLFEGLIGQSKNSDTGLLLQGFQHLCRRIEENGVGMQENSGALASLLREIEDKLDKIYRKD